jgi:hypothetical protein
MGIPGGKTRRLLLFVDYMRQVGAKLDKIRMWITFKKGGFWRIKKK